MFVLACVCLTVSQVSNAGASSRREHQSCALCVVVHCYALLYVLLVDVLVYVLVVYVFMCVLVCVFMCVRMMMHSCRWMVKTNTTAFSTTESLLEMRYVTSMIGSVLVKEMSHRDESSSRFCCS